MKIEWLNDEMTEAIVTRGALWWKKQAHVKQERDAIGPSVWRFVLTGEIIGGELHRLLIFDAVGIKLRADRERQERNWQPVRALPPARVVR